MRMAHRSVEVEAYGVVWLGSLAHDEAGRPLEVSFNDPGNRLKDSDAHHMIQDGAVLVSRWLQHGLPLDELASGLGRRPVDPLLPPRGPVTDGTVPASPLGAIVAAVAALAAEPLLPLEGGSDG